MHESAGQAKSPAMVATGEIGTATVTISYSAPSARERTIMGKLVPYGKVWRTGANKATSFEVSEDISVAGNVIEAGKYGLFSIPGENSWTIIFNKTWDQWGAFNYDDGEDVLRFQVKPSKTDEFVETFQITIENSMVIMKWENTQVSFVIKQ